MQQQVARDTKRDSSAMKSISLLTMVFLPATAIAVRSFALKSNVACYVLIRLDYHRSFREGW
jgi:hypothetical protein